MDQPILGKDKGDQKTTRGMESRLIHARTILVSEEVSDRLARRVAAMLVAMQDEDESAPITVYVNSPGGSADSGFAIFDMLRFVKPPVRAVCNGLCASAAVMIYLAAKREHRYSLPNSRFLLHQPSTAFYGAAADVKINAEEIIRLRERYNTIVAAETGKTEPQITKDADRDFWLSALQAKEYGLVGQVIEKFDEIH
ncbi:MAG: ATP-dependent Clp protease proteolytic subunit [Planctomycetes bacterium]|nr:ATP-dependent Clp protease proteolytic subunit [Planctomycetota bacterium]